MAKPGAGRAEEIYLTGLVQLQSCKGAGTSPCTQAFLKHVMPRDLMPVSGPGSSPYPNCTLVRPYASLYLYPNKTLAPVAPSGPPTPQIQTTAPSSGSSSDAGGIAGGDH